MIEAMRMPSGILVLAFLEFVDPDVEWPVADQLDVFPADRLPCRPRDMQLGVARRDVDDLRRIKADRLGDDRAPAFA